MDQNTVIDESEMPPSPVSPPTGRLLVKRGGHSITRQIPKPIGLVDSREQMPFDFAGFPNWIGGERRQALKVGDYSVEGMEQVRYSNASR